MALNRQSLSALFREVERQAKADERAARELRKDGVGLLTPQKMEEYAKGDQNLVLAYGRMGHTVSYSPAELREFLRARRKIAKQYADKKQGVPYRSLISASRPIDKKRAKTVKAAIWYGRKGNILQFSVSGVQQRFYRVQIRLEGWDKALTTNTQALKAAKQLVNGRLSIECSCGRHQYWYRYLCTIGNFAIQPQEHDFPKIKNPNLSGCCCKHILKVLEELQKSRVVFALSKELDKDRNTPGFSGNQRAHVLTNDLLRITTARMGKQARQLMDDWRQQLVKLKSTLQPRAKGPRTTTKKQTPPQPVKTPQQKQNTQPAFSPGRQFKANLRGALAMHRQYNIDTKPLLDKIAQDNHISRAQLDQYIKDNNL